MGGSTRAMVMVRAILRDTLGTYWTLVRTIVPVMVVTKVAVDLGLVEAVAPALAPLMNLLGLPSELGLAWLMGALVGFYAGVVPLFALVPISDLTTAQVTVYLGLLLVAHGLPIEQRVIQIAGPGLLATALLRLVGGFLYAYLLHLLFDATGWLNTPVAPHWIPAGSAADLGSYVLGAVQGLVWMFVILLVLLAVMHVLEAFGLVGRIASAFAPALRICGIGPSAAPVTIVGLLLGISFGSGLIKREAELGRVGPRDLFLACVLMGFAHSLIEDTLVVMALGGDAVSLLFGRLAFAIVAVAILARLIEATPDREFYRFFFRRQERIASP